MLRDRWKLTIEQEDSRYINLLLNKKTRSLTIFADGKRMAFLQAGIDILGIGEVFRQRRWDTENWEEQLKQMDCVVEAEVTPVRTFKATNEMMFSYQKGKSPA